MVMSDSKKSARANLVDLLKEQNISPEDMQTYRKIGDLINEARIKADKDCTGAGDKCYPGEDCGYKEGGCGTDECCNWCDSCMLTWDTCSSKMTCGEKMD